MGEAAIIFLVAVSGALPLEDPPQPDPLSRIWQERDAGLLQRAADFGQCFVAGIRSPLEPDSGRPHVPRFTPLGFALAGTLGERYEHVASCDPWNDAVLDAVAFVHGVSVVARSASQVGLSRVGQLPLAFASANHTLSAQ